MDQTIPGMPGKRVLAVDDEAAIRSLLRSILEEGGFTVDEASDGGQTIELVRRIKPDLVLLDIAMPGLDGFEVCRRLKSDPDTRAVPVIMCTADNRKDSLIAAIRAGAEDYVLKPFGGEQVLRRVRRVLAAHPLGTPPPGLGAEMRAAARRSTRWKVSWSGGGISGFASAYKCRVLDISIRGMAFEFVRCGECTGYEPGTVHPKCLFAPIARRYEDAPSIDFVLSISNDIVLELRGKIAHVLQPIDTPTTERVGVEFTTVPKECAAVIEQYVAGALAL